jgi:hypothetical protein
MLQIDGIWLHNNNSIQLFASLNAHSTARMPIIKCVHEYKQNKHIDKEQNKVDDNNPIRALTPAIMRCEKTCNVPRI